jgi:arylsulfatase A-like enzyme
MSRHGYWSGGSGKMLHYFIDAQSWDDYYPEAAKENPFPRTYYPKKRPVSIPRGGKWMYVETDWAPLDVTLEQYGGDYLVTDWVGKQLNREHDKPFFLACGIYRPHEPWFVPKEYFDKFPLDQVELPVGVKADDLDDLPTTGKKKGPNRYLAHIRKHGQWKKGVQGYLASIAFADDMLGRVLDSLEASPHRDNTIVVLWSDHGWHLGEKEHWQKFTGWRVCTRVPLMIRVPKGVAALPDGTPAGAVCDRPVNLVDLFSTITDLCGLPASDAAKPSSLLPLLRNPKAKRSTPSLTHLSNPGDYALSGQRWRYIHYTDGGEELYDIANDPYEWTNLAGDPKFADKLAEFRKQAPTDMAPKVETPKQ